MKVFSFISNLTEVSGVHKVLIDIHTAVKDVYDAKIVGTIPYEQINKNLKIPQSDYMRLSNPFIFNNSIVFIHERRYLLLFKIFNIILFGGIKIVYIHHSLLHGWKKIPVFPKHIVAISDNGIENLTKYFNVSMSRITKIYNCVIDCNTGLDKIWNNTNIYVLYPARICKDKQQLDIVKNLSGKIDRRVKILFAGDGPLYGELKEITSTSNQFIALGFRNDIATLLQRVSFVMLYSAYEGLPISLIEATMYGVPIICNRVGGNTEIAFDGENAFVADTWTGLLDILNKLPYISTQSYEQMSKNSRVIYEKNFTFETFKQKYLNLLANI